MAKPHGLIFAAGEIIGSDVAAALNEQGGPSWDRTVFRLLSGVDIVALAAGRPAAGGGTVVSLASSGWWLRELDDFADRLAKQSGVAVLAAFDLAEPAVAGWHLARPDGTPARGVTAGSRDAWAAGIVELTGSPLESAEVPPLQRLAMAVHGDDPKGADLPGIVCFGMNIDDAPEWHALLEVRGAALVAGCKWRPTDDRDPEADVPFRMRSLMLQTAVRLPGPPRWARATRAVAIRTAEEAVRADGWVCLVPGVDGAAAVYGTAVRILQLAPLADGSALGVLHPRVAVRVGGIRSGVASVDVIPPGQTRDADELQAVLGLVVDGLRRLKLSVQCTERELRMSEDPAAMLGWQLVLPAETCQAYLAARDPTARLRALADYLAVAG